MITSKTKAKTNTGRRSLIRRQLETQRLLEGLA